MSGIILKNEKVDAVKMGNELAMMNTDTGKYIIINEVGKDIWDLIDGIKTDEEIVTYLLEIYDIDQVTCQVEVQAFINQLLDEKLASRV